MANAKTFPCNDDKSPKVKWKGYTGPAPKTDIKGVPIPDGVIVIDVDLYKGVTLEAIEAVLGGTLNWTDAELQRTMKGGMHYGFSVAHDVVLRQGSDLLGVEGFDTRVSGKGYICTGKGYSDLCMFGVVDALGDPDLLPELPQAAVDALSDVRVEALAFEEVDEQAVDDFDGLVYGGGFSRDEVVAMVSKLDATCTNGEWVDIGMALHDWHAVDGLEVWEEWSKGGNNYTIGETEGRWRSFKKGVGGIGIGTLIYKSKEVAIVESVDVVAVLKDKITLASEIELKGVLAKEVRSTILDNIGREQIAKAFSDRFVALTGVKPQIKDVREMLRCDAVNLTYDTPQWCDDWVYVNSHGKFMQIHTLEAVGAEGFNVRFGQLVPINATGTKCSAVKYVSDSGYIKSVAQTAYLPMISDAVCSTDQGEVLNTFNQNSVPCEAHEYTDEGLKHIEYIKQHIKLLFKDDISADIFTQWLAHNVQRPGVKIPWAPLIQSVQGVGKTIISQLLEGCLGVKNVGAVSPKVVISDFNGWATGRVVNVLEELRMQGHNRHEAANALKPLITDKTITINDKCISAYTTPNTANYIAFTNFKDCVPLDSSDRRWWVTYVQLDSLDDIQKITGVEQELYFDRVWSAVRNHCGELKKWLLEIKITDGFKALNVAPRSVHKDMMIATEQKGPEWAEEIKELIATGGEFFCDNAVSSKDLFNTALFSIDGFQEQSPRSKGQILKSLGYSRLPKRIKIRGSVKTFWVKHHLENGDVKDLFPF